MKKNNKFYILNKNTNEWYKVKNIAPTKKQIEKFPLIRLLESYKDYGKCESCNKYVDNKCQFKRNCKHSNKYVRGELWLPKDFDKYDNQGGFFLKDGSHIVLENFNKEKD